VTELWQEGKRTEIIRYNILTSLAIAELYHKWTSYLEFKEESSV